MQEDIENKVVVLIENCSKLTARELAKALEKVLADAKAGHQRRQAKGQHGRMSVKQLAEKEQGMQSVEVNDRNTGAFSRVARKYGIDYAPFKVKGENRYLVFFKAPDKDAMVAAFTEYTQRQLQKASRPSILQKLEHYKSLIRQPIKEKTRHKEPER